MAKGIKLIDVDKGWNAIKKDLKDLRGSYVKVGILGAKAAQPHPSEDGKAGGAPLTNVDLAVIHEFGAPAANIPARPFVSGAYQKNATKYQALLQKGMAKVFERKLTIARMLGLIGAQAARDMKELVIKGASPFAPNSPETIARKSAKAYQAPREKEGPIMSSRPLVDTGRMVGSITWGVRLGSRKETEGTVSSETAVGHEGVSVNTTGDE